MASSVLSRSFRCGVACLSIAAGLPPSATGQTDPLDPPAGLDAYVNRVMGAFEVPGLALAIVRNGQVVVARGYGVRQIDHSDPVDEHTRFGIASNTKAFTATALALLVEEGRLEWDAPVIRYLPWFQMWDPWVTREITVRDLLVHRSGLGLGQGDLLGTAVAYAGHSSGHIHAASLEGFRDHKHAPVAQTIR